MGDELFSTKSHHLYVLYGMTNDLICSPDLRQLSIEQWLLAHLNNRGCQRIVFYDAIKKIYFLDESSARLAQNRKESAVKTGENTDDRSSRTTTTKRMVGGPIQQTRIRATPTTPQPGHETTALKETDSIKWDFGLMKDAEATSALNKWMRESKCKTAIIFRNAEDILGQLDNDAVRSWNTILANWTSVKLGRRNLNLAIFIFSKDPTNVGMLPILEKELFSNIEGERAALKPEISHYIGPPRADEVRNLLHCLRLSEPDFLLTPTQIAQQAVPLAQSLIPEKMDESEEGILELEEKVIQQKSQKIGSSWSELEKLEGLNEIIKPKIDRLVEVAKHRLDKVRGQPAPLQGFRVGRMLKSQPLSQDEKKLANLHLALLGKPGTGKTTVARIIARIFREEGILESGHLVEVTREDLVAGYVGQTAIKTGKAINRAMGGILFIDEAYALSNKGNENDFGSEAIETLLKAMSDFNGQFAVIIAGYTKEISDFIDGPNANPGLSRRFPQANRWVIPDYSAESLYRIFLGKLEKDGYHLDDALVSRLPQAFSHWHADASRAGNFGNVGAIENLIQAISGNAGERSCLNESDIAFIGGGWDIYLGKYTPPTMEELLQSMSHLIGLSSVKEKMVELANKRLLDLRLDKPLAGSAPGHYVFTGNPGTGKTTVARLMGDMFLRLGLLQKGHTIEKSAKDLVGQRVGDAQKFTDEAIRQAMDGVLFIDEAYQLLDDQFGRAVIETLVAAMENQRHCLCLIVAGYPDEMRRFIASNAGFESRFQMPITFDDFNTEELMEISLEQIAKNGFHLSEAGYDALKRRLEFDYQHRQFGFGNARYVRKLWDEGIHARLASRIIQIPEGADAEIYRTIEAGDIPEAGRNGA